MLSTPTRTAVRPRPYASHTHHEDDGRVADEGDGGRQFASVAPGVVHHQLVSVLTEVQLLNRPARHLPTQTHRVNDGVLKAKLGRVIIIAERNTTIVAFSFAVLFNRRRSLVIALLLSIARWPLKMSDYPLVAPRVFCDIDGGNRIQTASLGHAVESAIGF